MNDTPHQAPGYYDADACALADFAQLAGQKLDPKLVPQATDIQKNIPLYDMAEKGSMLNEKSTRRSLMTEWAQVLGKGAGVFVLRSAVQDLTAIDAATTVFDRIIADEKARHGGGADHFAAAGSNDRIWNSLQKLCEADPEVFVRYHGSPAVDAACEAWLGPNYQMTAQVNLVHPGGKPQQAHRDYHLGFQTADISASYPAHVHDLSPLMTLQGGIAHCDVPLNSGPTKLLPFSQLYKPGYVAWRRQDFRNYFEEHCVQLPLAKGDAVFFNPALFHAAGANSSSDIHRMVNLLQISSAFGRAMETIDRTAMSLRVLEPMIRLSAQGDLSVAELDAAIAATAEGYSFPTNLDRDPPVGGLAPKTQAALLKEAVDAQTSTEGFNAQLRDWNKRRQA